MNSSKNKEFIDRSINGTKKLRKNEKILKNNEIDAKNLELICYNHEINNQQLPHDFTKRFKIKNDEKKESTIVLRLKKGLSNTYEWLVNIRGKINQFFDQLYLKVPGYLFGIIGLILQIFSTYLALIIYLTADPTYSISHNWISELGIGLNGSNIIFCMGWIVSSGFIFLFNVNEIRSLEKKMKTKSRASLLVISNIIFTLGIFLVGFFPTNLLVYHVIGATFYFLGGFIFFSYYGIVAFLNKRVPIFHAFIACILSTCFVLFLLSPKLADPFLEIGITTTSAEWSIFLFEISLMLLILKYSLIENYYSRNCENGLKILVCRNVNKIELDIKLTRNIHNII